MKTINYYCTVTLFSPIDDSYITEWVGDDHFRKVDAERESEGFIKEAIDKMAEDGFTTAKIGVSIYRVTDENYDDAYLEKGTVQTYKVKP